MSTEVLVTTGRRSWPTEVKRQIIAEAAQPGSSVSAVARTYNIDPGQLYQWRKKLKPDLPAQKPVAQAPAFLPVDVCDGPSASDDVELDDTNRTGRAEIAFPCGVHLFLPVDLDRELMDRLIAAVRSA